MEKREFRINEENIGQRVDKVISEKYEDISNTKQFCGIYERISLSK